MFAENLLTMKIKTYAEFVTAGETPEIVLCVGSAVSFDQSEKVKGRR